jgi:hypothetical protein
MINSLGVMGFGRWTGVLNFCSVQNWTSSDIWTFDPNSNVISRNLNTNIVANFLNFLKANYTPYPDKQNKSYNHQKVAGQRRFQ